MSCLIVEYQKNKDTYIDLKEKYQQASHHSENFIVEYLFFFFFFQYFSFTFFTRDGVGTIDLYFAFVHLPDNKCLNYNF